MKARLEAIMAAVAKYPTIKALVDAGNIGAAAEKFNEPGSSGRGPIAAGDIVSWAYRRGFLHLFRELSVGSDSVAVRNAATLVNIVLGGVPVRDRQLWGAIDTLAAVLPSGVAAVAELESNLAGGNTIAAREDLGAVDEGELSSAVNLSQKI